MFSISNAKALQEKSCFFNNKQGSHAKTHTNRSVQLFAGIVAKSNVAFGCFQEGKAIDLTDQKRNSNFSRSLALNKPTRHWKHLSYSTEAINWRVAAKLRVTQNNQAKVRSTKTQLKKQWADWTGESFHTKYLTSYMYWVQESLEKVNKFEI